MKRVNNVIKSKLYFDKHITIRINNPVNSMINKWVKNPICVDSFGRPLYKSRSHFVKCAILRELDYVSNLFD